MSDILDRLKNCNTGMGTRNPDDYLFFMTVVEANIVQDKIDSLVKELEAVKAENKEFKDWVWHKKYSEASSQGASHEIAKDFADNGIKLLINKEG